MKNTKFKTSYSIDRLRRHLNWTLTATSGEIVGKIEYATGRFVIAALCYFAWYLICAILTGYVEFESGLGYVFLGVALLNLLSIGFVFASENNRVRASVILNLVSLAPVFYYGFTSAPKGIS